MVDIVQNVMNALMDTPALTLILINSMVVMGLITFWVLSKRPNKVISAFIGLLIFINLVLALPLAIDLIFK